MSAPAASSASTASGSSASASAPGAAVAPAQLTAFQQLAKRNEIDLQTQQDLISVLPQCAVTLVFDDSDSMTSPIAEESTDPFAPQTSTRWMEMKKMAVLLLQFVTALVPEGVTVRFLNRAGVSGITRVDQMGSFFQTQPDGGTPLITALREVFKQPLPAGKRYHLVIVVTDGEPTDGTHQDLFNLLNSKPSHVHVSFAEVTDDAASMDYLDRWDGKIAGFDNTDDYREELGRVTQMQGANFKFNRTQYICKILLATFIRYYFQLDQARLGGANRWMIDWQGVPAYGR